MNPQTLRLEALSELTENILPFWMERMVDPRGGFHGRIDGHNTLIEGSDKGLILNARILWTFASAYRMLGDEKYLLTAQRAKDEIIKKFMDPDYGGAYWSLGPDGTPSDTRKQFYAIAFAVYGLAEHYRATGEDDALKAAISLYRSIEDHSRDREKGGYVEAATRDWSPIEDMRLSEKDENFSKTMNTHLHILEAYACLYRVWKDEELHESLKSLIKIFLDRIIQPDGHLGLFFDDDWKLHSHIRSYGHDIETSWLLVEAAEVLCGSGEMEDRLLHLEVLTSSRDLATAASEGLTESGMIYEYDPDSGYRKTDRDWWVQAESVVGFLNRYSHSADESDLEKAFDAWDYIKREIIAPDGEWYWGRKEDGSINLADDRAGFWKCPYHNGRMCMEVLSRIKPQE